MKCLTTIVFHPNGRFSSIFLLFRPTKQCFNLYVYSWSRNANCILDAEFFRTSRCTQHIQPSDRSKLAIKASRQVDEEGNCLLQLPVESLESYDKLVVDFHFEAQLRTKTTTLVRISNRFHRQFVFL